MAFALPQDSYVEKMWDYADLTHSFHWRGVDHGFNPDPTACVFLAYNKRKGYWQIYNEYKQSKLLIHQHADAIRGLESFAFITNYSDIDPQIIAEYNAIGFPLTPAGKYDKNARILRIVNALKTGKLKIASNCTMLLSEMQNYVWEQDGNDHLIDSLIYGFTNAVIPQEVKVTEIDTLPRRINFDDGFDGQDFGD
jgi:phage terminase large subunit